MQRIRFSPRSLTAEQSTTIDERYKEYASVEERTRPTDEPTEVQPFACGIVEQMGFPRDEGAYGSNTISEASSGVSL
jgi:hypothetical protein